jgi:hypothetical protein
MAEKKNDQITTIQDDALDIFAKFDQLDDQAVIKEIEGRVVDAWVYHFPMDGKDIWGIGKEGVDQCALHLSKKGYALREENVWFEPDPKNGEYVIFFAKVNLVLVDKGGNEARVESTIGTKRQWTLKKIKQKNPPYYKIVQNQFWAEQGAIKALRNAKLRLIPEEIKAKVIANAKKLKKVVEVEPLRTTQKQAAASRQGQTKSAQKPESGFPEEQTEAAEEAEQAGLPEEPVSVMDKRSLAPQGLRMDITNYMNTLVDKYRVQPDDILERMDKKIGHHTISEFTIEQAEIIKEHLEWAIDKLEVKRTKEEQQQKRQ